MKEQVCRDNGRYQYHYDCLNRLTEVQKDGTCIRQYEYDAFGNRIRKQEGDRQTRYYYNAADQLIREEGEHSEQTYQYDRRGNLTAVFDGGSMAYRYLYDETGRLSMSMNAEGRLAGYRYNGLGHRTGIQEYALTGAISEPLFPADLLSDATPVREVDYLLDLTREYHNLLERTERNGREESAQFYIWDTNAVFLKEDKITYIYLQDELGSPVRLMQARGEKQTLYGYDEFGSDRYGNQGEMQPFGYTGYQRDWVTGSYFAQAREYLPEVGRFMGQDLIKGMANFPFTLNEYGYCWNNPLMLVDKNGAWPEWIETTAKVLTVTTAVVAVGAVIVGTGGAAGVILAGAAVGGTINGFANENSGGSYINGWCGGAVAGGIQAFAGYHWGGVGMLLGGAGNGIGSFVTDVLDNIDPYNDKYKTEEQVLNDAWQNAHRGVICSIPGFLMGWMVGFANQNKIAKELMQYSPEFGEVLNQIFGAIDNILLVDWNGGDGDEIIENEGEELCPQ